MIANVGGAVGSVAGAGGAGAGVALKPSALTWKEGRKAVRVSVSALACGAAGGGVCSTKADKRYREFFVLLWLV